MVKKTDGNDPAFATQDFFNDKEISYGTPGLTKREYFAAMVMQALITKSVYDFRENIAHHSVLHADSLIEALNKEK
jgi:hypothetical protein